MKTVIIDDEKPAISILTKFVSKVPFLQLSLASTNAFDALELINDKHVDLLFLDIEMPDITGLEFLASLEYRPLVIITTAYEQYAIAGYDLDIADYLLKPIDFQRFYKSVMRAIARIPQPKDSLAANNTLNIAPNATPKDHFFIKADYKLINIHFNDILYVEGMREYIRIHTKDQRITTLLSMSKLMKMLPINQFARIHRSYIVNLRNIKEIAKNTVVIGDKRLPISQGKREQFMELVAGLGEI